MPDFAKHVEITRNGRYGSLRIDGQEMPWYVGEKIEVRHQAGEMCAVVLTIPAERVTSDDNLDPYADDAPVTAPTAPQQNSMLDAAKLSLKEAERLEASAGEIEHHPTNNCSPGSPDAERVENLRQLGRDELLLASTQASIAVAEALAAEPPVEDLVVDDESEGHKVGTAYVEIRPDFEAFQGEEFKAAIDKAVRDALRRL